MALWSLAEEAVSMNADAIHPDVALAAWAKAENCADDERAVLYVVRILRVPESVIALAVTTQVSRNSVQKAA